MRKLMLVMLVVALLGVAGCGLPQGIKGCLYTAQITSEVTVDDVNAGRYPFDVVEGETDEQQIVRFEKQVDILVRTLEQVNNNLVVVVDFVQNGKTETEEVTE